ncbi:AAA family ATPase [Echinicola salinicaeni]|uniref:AAA family ATPase n=1 Tax=Echinicola salinicaeni TaxID=2762757 RepID=UPI0016486BF9|nr:AAA family ATPase [Echinicola salinicaeni]
MLIMVMGLPGTGKSYLAAKIARALGAVHLKTDVIRKDLGLSNQYSKKDKMKVYKEMERRAKLILGKGDFLVLDATFYLMETRKPFFNLAAKQHVSLVKLLVEADESVVSKRMAMTREDSEADFDVYLKIKEVFDPVLHPYLSLISHRSNINEILQQALNYIKLGEDKA